METLLIAQVGTKAMEVKSGIEKDKQGNPQVLVLLTRRDVQGLKEFANKYWQDDPNNTEDLTGLAKAQYKVLHEIWKQMNPS